MPNRPHPDPLPAYRERGKFVLAALPLALYCSIAIPATIHWLERLNSDGVCYLHRAMLLASGDIHNSISAYWSPGLIVSTAAALKLGIDPLHTIHWMLCLWGAVFVVGAQWFFDNLRWKTVASCIVSLLAVRMIGPVITPDVLLGAAMMFYMAALLRRRWLLAGLIAGIGFLSKAYFLPFVLLQFPIWVAMQRGGWRALGMGIFGLFLIAGPWIAVLSVHEGRLTFSSATRRNRFMQDVAPADVLAHPPDVSSLPPNPFLSNMEVTDHDAWPAWSPLDSGEHFDHQLSVVRDHLKNLIVDLWRFDYIALLLAAFLVSLIWGDADARSLAISGGIYAGGFMLVAYETRYILPVLLPIGVALLVMVGTRSRWRALPLILLLPAFCGAMYSEFLHLSEKQPALTYRQIAAELRSRGLDGCFVTNTANRDRAACTAFSLMEKFIAMPNDEDVAALQSKLDTRGIRLLFRWYDPQYKDRQDWPEAQTRALIADGMWQKATSIHLDSLRRLDVYQRLPVSMPMN